MLTKAHKTLILIVLMLLAVLMVAFAQDSLSIKEWREISDFDKIHIQGKMEVYLIQSPVF
jgi:hypothetical protein